MGLRRLLRRDRTPHPKVRTREALAHLLGEPVETIESLRARPDQLYGCLRLPKKSGGSREIHPPRAALKRVQRRILAEIDRRFRPSPFAHGGVAGRSIVSHAAPHMGRRMVATLDLRDFFPSVPLAAVRELLEVAGFEDGALEDLIFLVTREAKLPQGAPTSGCLANLAFDAADLDLDRLARRRQLTYTRYVDDLAFSGDRDFRDLAGPFADLIRAHGFLSAPEKRHFMGRERPQVVTGLLVNDRLRPTREFRESLTIEVRRLATDARAFAAEEGRSRQELRARILGRIHHLARFDRPLADRLRRRLGKTGRGSPASLSAAGTDGKGTVFGGPEDESGPK